MSTRKGDWRDLFSAHLRAADTKKLWMGFVAVLASLLVITAAAAAHGAILGSAPYLGRLGNLSRTDNVIRQAIGGHWLSLWRGIAPLLNPFAGGVVHFLVVIVLYLVLLRIWVYCGGVISRVTALQYGRDELPSMKEVSAMARKKWNSYFFAPVIPLAIVIALGLVNLVIGLAGSVPYVGSVFLICGNFLAAINTAVLVFVGVLGLLSFGLMLPAISIGGKDAFEGFSSAYSYVLWGLNRFLCYTLLACLLGAIFTAVAGVLAQVFIDLLRRTLEVGLVGANEDILLPVVELMKLNGSLGQPPFIELSLGGQLAAIALTVIAFFANAMVAAYSFSYFFTSNTIICLLMRKHVDRIEIEEIYTEEAEQEEPEAVGVPEETSEPSDEEPQQQEQQEEGE